MEKERKTSIFDDIVAAFEKNGITPKKQTILSVLKDIGQPVGKESWKIKHEGQLPLGDL